LKGAVSTYDSNQIISALSEYHKALSKLPYVEEVDILCPPPSGWPNITKENFSPLGKTDEVIDLLKRLPYLRGDDGGGEGYAVYFGTFVIDYAHKPFATPIDRD
jgi:hypothetical protein